MKIAQLTTDNRDHYEDYSCPTPYFGTAPEALLQGLECLPGLEVHVISCTREPAASPRQIGANIFFHGLHVPKWGWMRTGFQGCVRAIRAELRRIQPDIVHGQGSERECALSAALSGFPNVVTIHGNMANVSRVLRSRVGSYVWLAARLETFALRRTAGVLCNSGHTEALVRNRARRIWRVPNAVRPAFFSAVPPVQGRKVQLLNVGVICSNKRQVELLDYLTRLRSEGLQFEIVFVGHSSPTSSYASEFLEKLGRVSGWAKYVGLKPVNELIPLMDQSSALIHVPREESFGLVVAEGLARGLKFLGFAIGGVPDIVEGVPGAELFADGDWEAMGQALSRWLRQGAPPPSMASGLMQARYSPEVVAQRHLDIYREVLNS